MKSNDLTNEERYALNYAKGLRQGRIISCRKVLLRVVNIHSKEQSVKPSKALIQKIKWDTDYSKMLTAIFAVANNKISIAELENCYDMIFRTEEDIKNGRYTVYGVDD